MALTEGQASVRDLVMGRGTAYKLISFNPWARQVRADQAGARAWGHGSWSGVEWAAEAVVPMRVQVLGQDAASWMTLHQQLAFALRPVGESTVDVELRWVTGGTEYMLSGRPRMVEPEATMIGTGLVYTQAGFVALDPFIYAGQQTLVEGIGLPRFTGGLTVPARVPFTVGGVAAAGSAQLTNTGTADTGLLLRIDGPVPTPSIVLDRADGGVQRLDLDLDIEAGQWLDIDTRKRLVLLNGASSRRGDASGQWPILPPGTSTLSWSSPRHNDDAQLSAAFRSAWY
jgi:hypothetical protein